MHACKHCICVYLCVCVCEREREKGGMGEREKKTDRESLVTNEKSYKKFSSSEEIFKTKPDTWTDGRQADRHSNSSIPHPPTLFQICYRDGITKHLPFSPDVMEHHQ